MIAQWRLVTGADARRLSFTSEPAPWRADEFESLSYQRQAGGAKLPRNHQRRSYRLGSGADVSAIVTLQYLRADSRIQVQRILFGDDPELVTAREVWTYVLTESWRCGGTCELSFACSPPPAFWRVAAEAGIAETRELSDEDGRRLFAEVLGLGADARAMLDEIESDGRCRAGRVCYLAGVGQWLVSELEVILLQSSLPEAICRGEVDWQDPLRATCITDHARTAILGGRLERALRWGAENRGRAGPRVRVIREPAARILSAGDRWSPRLPEGWWRGGPPFELSADGETLVVSCAAAASVLDEIAIEAVQVASEARSITGAARAAALFPYDVAWMSHRASERLLEAASSLGVSLLCAREPLDALTLETVRRLRFARMVRG